MDEGPAWVAAYLEGDLCQAARALDVEAEDGQAQVGLILYRFLASTELLAPVNVFSTCLTSHVEGGRQPHYILPIFGQLELGNLRWVKVRGVVFLWGGR